LFLLIARWVDRRVLSRAQVIVCVSSTIKQQIDSHYGINGDHVIVQPNACDIRPETTDGPATVEGLAPAHKMIGFVGGFYPWHGLPLLARAFLCCLETEPDARLLLIGEGPEKARIETLLREQGALDKAIFTGQIPHAQISGYLQRFDIGVMPDSNDYGSPMKIFEYMALGIPVVAPDYPPIQEVLDGQGICFAKQDVDSFAAALGQLLADPELRRKQGQRGMELVRQRYNWQANADQTLAALDTQGYSFCLTKAHVHSAHD
jgi:glycosyltransferase involved in cell wall biosynthesis